MHADALIYYVFKIHMSISIVKGSPRLTETIFAYFAFMYWALKTTEKRECRIII